jgi:hypothetical protein
MQVTTLSGLSLQINLTIQIMAPDSDNEEPGDEIVHESHPIFMAKSKWAQVNLSYQQVTHLDAVIKDPMRSIVSR